MDHRFGTYITGPILNREFVEWVSFWLRDEFVDYGNCTLTFLCEQINNLHSKHIGKDRGTKSII